MGEISWEVIRGLKARMKNNNLEGQSEKINLTI